jgi:hypothetical protein
LNDYAPDAEELRRIRNHPMNQKLNRELLASFERCFGKNKREPKRKRNRHKRVK